MKRLFSVLLTILSVCSLANELEIKANAKDARIFIISKDGSSKSIGKTPLKGDFKSLIGNGKEYVHLEIKKDGFKTYSVVLPPFVDGDLSLYAKLEIEKNISHIQDFDLLASDLFDVLRMVRLRDYQSSLMKLDELIKKFPHYSIVYEMKGMILYLQKDYKLSLNFYTKAFSINPKNREAYRMKNYLVKKFGLKEEII